jgi:hypothetical protein
MANAYSRMEINRYGLVFGISVVVVMVLNFLFQIYWRGYSSAEPVFPMNIEGTETVRLRDGYYLKQQFRVTHEQIDSIEFMIDQENTNGAGLVQLSVAGGATEVGLELELEELKATPLLAIKLPQEITMETLASLTIALKSEDPEATLGLYTRQNRILDRPAFGGQLWLGGINTANHLVFKPRYGQVPLLVEGQGVRLTEEMQQIFERVVAGKPAWVKASIMVLPVLVTLLFGLMAYIAWVIILGKESQDEQAQLLKLLGLIGLVGLLIL